MLSSIFVDAPISFNDLKSEDFSLLLFELTGSY